MAIRERVVKTRPLQSGSIQHAAISRSQENARILHGTAPGLTFPAIPGYGRTSTACQAQQASAPGCAFVPAGGEKPGELYASASSTGCGNALPAVEPIRRANRRIGLHNQSLVPGYCTKAKGRGGSPEPPRRLRSIEPRDRQDRRQSCEGSSEREREPSEFQSRKGISEIEGKAKVERRPSRCGIIA